MPRIKDMVASAVRDTVSGQQTQTALPTPRPGPTSWSETLYAPGPKAGPRAEKQAREKRVNNQLIHFMACIASGEKKAVTVQDVILEVDFAAVYGDIIRIQVEVFYSVFQVMISTGRLTFFQLLGMMLGLPIASHGGQVLPIKKTMVDRRASLKALTVDLTPCVKITAEN